MLQWDMGGNDEAAASFERAMVLNPREGKVFYNYGALLVEKDIPRSRWASDRALEFSPDSIFFRLIVRHGRSIGLAKSIGPGRFWLGYLPERIRMGG